MLELLLVIKVIKYVTPLGYYFAHLVSPISWHQQSHNTAHTRIWHYYTSKSCHYRSGLTVCMDGKVPINKEQISAPWRVQEPETTVKYTPLPLPLHYPVQMTYSSASQPSENWALPNPTRKMKPFTPAPCVVKDLNILIFISFALLHPLTLRNTS